MSRQRALLTDDKHLSPSSFSDTLNRYTSLNTACHSKQKPLLRSKFIKNLLFTKYLMSATTTLLCSELFSQTVSLCLL